LELRHFKLLEQLVLREAGGEELSMDLPGHLRILLKPEELYFECRASSESLQELAREEVVLSIPGVQAIPGTPWIAEARWLDEDATEEVRLALRAEDWDNVWRILHSTRYVVYIDGDRAGETLCVRTRLPGDRIQPLGMQYEKKVQDVLVNRHIPRVERDQLPLFFNREQHCVWLGGVTLDQRVRLTSETQRILCLLLKKQSTGEGHYA
jgi:tRNA(Ile)-lysidine synthase